MEVDVPVWQGSALNVVDDEMMAVAASRKRFWKAFDAQLGLSCEDTDQGGALATLARRRGGCKGLTAQMIANEVAVLRECASMSAYNTEFILAAFNAIAQPDWEVWDILEKCLPDEEDVTSLSADALCDKLGTRLASTVNDKPALEAVVDRLHTWRQAKSNSSARNKEAEYLVAYRNRNEAWNQFRLCTIRFVTLADYRAGLLHIPTVSLAVRAGEELRALREYFKKTQRKRGVMSPFNVDYSVGDDEGFNFHEGGTIDCGGPTKRMLSSAWFQYWDNVDVSSTWHVHRNWNAFCFMTVESGSRIILPLPSRMNGHASCNLER